jgi:uncharacterized membrane protein
VHSQIAALGDQYTSFCNVNSSINCDKVLGSPWSKVGSVPIAWLALASYTGLALLFGMACRKGRDGRAFLALATAGVIGSLVFSVYMAAVSTLVLGTICLLCTTLYAVALTLGVLCWLAARSYAAAYPQAPSVLPRNQAIGALLAAAAVTGLIATASTPETQADLSSSGTSLEELEAGDPSFYVWYTSQPRISHRALRLTEDERSDRLVTLIEYSDFDCGHCRRNAELLRQFASRRGDLLHVVHRHFPLDAKCNGALPTSLHPNACRAAEAAECAGEQNLQSAMSKILFDNQGKFFDSNLFDLADQAGVNAAQFRTCMENHDTLDAVVADARSGEALELSSTPTLFLNGRRVVGTFENVAAYERAVLIEAALAAP